MDFDYLVIGGGSGGMASARRAAEYGAKVAVIENKKLGGTCVNVGCVPKKIMWNASYVAEILELAKGYGFNISEESKQHTWSQIKSTRDSYIKRLNGIYQNNLDKGNITTIFGTAKFIDNQSVEVNKEIISAKHILIAVGGAPSRPPVEGAELGIDSNGFFELESLPKRVAVIGGGYIATELAGVLHGLGADVTQVVRRMNILPVFDTEIVDVVFEAMTKSGVNMLMGHSPKRLEKTTDDKIILHTQENSVEKSHEPFDCVLWATGRKPDLEALDLAKTNVKVNQRGYIEVDEFSNTDAKNIYAVGDIISGGIELTPVAIAAGRALAERLFNGKNDSKLDYTNIASVVFSHPPIGTVGLSERDAIKHYGEDKMKVYKSQFVNMIYAVSDLAAEDKPKTLVKLVTLKQDKWHETQSSEYEKVIGCHIVGDAADEIIQGFVVAVKMGASKADFDRTVAIHPTAAEELVTLR